MMHGFVACLVCLLVIAPRLAAALDLGPIEARSALYEPLDARIGIDGVRSGDLDGLTVVLGSPAQFELAGVARLPHLELLEFTLVKQDDGDGYIRVWTDEPIIEPSLTFLVDVEWPRGRAVRGYKLHFPAGVGTAGASSSRRTAAAQTESEPASAAPAPSPPVGTTYGPVGSSDTLWSIAIRFRPDKSISVQRMMLAILEANPRAFAIRNVNALNAGAILRIPTLDEIGPDDVDAAIAETQSQNSAWKEYREGRRSAAAAATPESELASTARVEVVSSETTPRAAEDADASALRGRLALAMEEADTERRQANELKLRLVEAEDQIRKLGRLIELQNEEIAALQAQLQAGVAATPAPSAMEPMPTPVPSEAEPTPSPLEAEPAPSPSELEPMPSPSEAELMSTPAPSETTPDAAEPETTPFGLGALPINPVFLVGGAGLLLILLGVVALLRRRRASSGEDDVAELMGGADDVAADDSASADDDDFLRKLKSVAADPADATDAPRRRDAQAAPGVDSPDDANPDAGESAVLRLDPDSPAHGRTAEQTDTERALPGMVDEDDDADVSFDIDALTRDDFDSSTPGDKTGDEFNLDDLEELTALAPDRDSDGDARSDEAIDEPDDLRALPPEEDADGAPDELAGELDDMRDLVALPPEEDADGALDELAGELDELAGELDDMRDLAALSPGDDADGAFDELGDELDDLRDLAPLTPEGDSTRTAPASRDPGPGPDDAEESDLEPESLFDATTDGGDAGAFSFDDIGEDEMQTKLDLAQVYMEMGDADSARGFLEAVLADGDTDQRDVARDMLSRLA